MKVAIGWGYFALFQSSILTALTYFRTYKTQLSSHRAAFDPAIREPYEASRAIAMCPVKFYALCVAEASMQIVDLGSINTLDSKVAA